MDNYRQRIDNIKNNVGVYSSENKKTKSYFPSMDSIPKFKPQYIYGIIPIVILIILLIFRPNFIKYEKIDNDGNEQMKVGFYKLIVWTLGISIILCIGLFAYNFKKLPIS
jgi:hypothetical protein